MLSCFYALENDVMGVFLTFCHVFAALIVLVRKLAEALRIIVEAMWMLAELNSFQRGSENDNKGVKILIICLRVP
jgi:hypothetical protein